MISNELVTPGLVVSFSVNGVNGATAVPGASVRLPVDAPNMLVVDGDPKAEGVDEVPTVLPNPPNPVEVADLPNKPPPDVDACPNGEVFAAFVDPKPPNDDGCVELVLLDPKRPDPDVPAVLTGCPKMPVAVPDGLDAADWPKRPPVD